MQPGDIIKIVAKRHPFHGCRGTVVGIRGELKPDDVWLLVLVHDRNRSMLIPCSMVKLENEVNKFENN